MTLHEVFMESKEIRRLIVERSEKYQIPLYYLCKETGIEYEVFMKGYINSGSWDSANITEEQFTKLLNCLGIGVRYQIVIDERRDMVAEGKQIALKYAEKRVRS